MAERRQRVEELFDAALGRAPQERASFLSEACASDPDLRAEVESLISAHERSGSFLDAPAYELAAHLFSQSEAEAIVGRRIGHYEVVALLGQGGMGEVYLVKNKQLDRRVALKLLPLRFTEDEVRLRRFVREAKAASSLNHPNILTIYEIGQEGATHFIATEYIEGETLRQRMRREPVTLGAALDIAIQVAGALSTAHEAGIVHRDIKPENIMLRPDGYIKVLDFGLAKLTEPSSSPGDNHEETQAGSATDPGVVMGTPKYMSPEQARGQAVDGCTDIFSLGVMLYEMVAGRAPFDGPTPSDVIAAILKDEPQSLVECAPEAPAELGRVVKRALAKDRNDRYQTFTDLSADLKRLKEEIELNAKLGLLPPTRTRETASATEVETRRIEPETHPISENKRHRRGALLGLVVILLAVATIAVFIVISLYPSKEEAPRASPTSRSLTFRPGFVTRARFAPDGKTVLYSAGFDGGPVELFTTGLENPESRSLGLTSVGLQSVSSTGEMAVLLDSELDWGECHNGTLAVVPMAGSLPRPLIENVYDADWAPDGKTFAIVRAEGGQHQLEYPMGEVLYRSQGQISHARVSPQGDKIAFLDHPILGDMGGSVAVVDLNTKNIKLVSTEWRFVFGLVWSPTGDEIWFTGSRMSKKRALHAVTLTGLERILFEAPAQWRLQDVSADGRVLLVRGSGGHSRMMYLSAHSSKERGLKLFDWSTSADLSPDGKTLLFYEWGNAVDTPSVYLRKIEGSDAVRLGEGRALALSPDGQWALAVQETQPPQLVLLPTTPGEPRALPNPGIREFHYASWFPDGRHILFTALEPERDLRSYIQDIEGGEPRALTEEGIVALMVSPDGKRLLTLDYFDNRYYLYPLDGTASTPIPRLELPDEPIQWSADGRALYVRGPEDFACKVYRVELASGRRKLWREIIPPDPVGLIGIEARRGGILITPDGESCIYTFWTLLHELILMEGLK